jgi:hypothetical protein
MWVSQWTPPPLNIRGCRIEATLQQFRVYLIGVTAARIALILLRA